MDEAIAWFQHFLDVEWAAVQAYHVEPDEDAFEAAADAYRDLKDDDVGEALNRTGTPEDMAELAQIFERRAKRVLYAARPMTADGADAWAFYTSNFTLMPTGRTMSSMFIVQSEADSYRVQADYARCFDCGATGMVDGEVCDTCDGLGFEHEEGVDFDELSPAGETRKFEAPTNPRSTAAYEAL